MKKYLVVLLTVLLLAASLLGCNSAGKTEESKPQTNNEGTATETTEEMPKVSIINQGFSVEEFPEHADYAAELQEAILEYGLNVELVFVPGVDSGYSEKLVTQIAGGDIPDIMFFRDNKAPEMAAQNILVDLTPYIEQSEIVKNALSKASVARMESFPYLLRVFPLSTRVPVIRQDWFAELETGETLLANPTVDNYYAFFQELKEKKSEYAITADGRIYELDAIFAQAFGQTATWLKDGNGGYVHQNVSDAEKEKLAFYAKLYEEELLDPGFISKKWDTKEQSFYTGESAVICGSSGKVIDIFDNKMMEHNGETATLMMLPPATGVSQGFHPADVTQESRGFAISTQAPDIDLAWKVLEFLVSYEGQYVDQLGVEGKHYNIEDGKIVLTPEHASRWAWFFEVPGWEPEMELSKPLLGTVAVQSLVDTETYFAADNNYVIPEDLAAYKDAADSIYKAWAIDFVTGTKSLDEFDAFVEEWYANGGDELTQYANENIG